MEAVKTYLRCYSSICLKGISENNYKTSVRMANLWPETETQDLLTTHHRQNPTEIKNRNIRDLCRGINEFKNGYQPVTNLVKDENDDLLANLHSILNRWKNYYHLLNVHGVKDVRQTEMHTAEPLLPEPSPFEVEIVI
jgi:hypothetical protein